MHPAYQSHQYKKNVPSSVQNIFRIRLQWKQFRHFTSVAKSWGSYSALRRVDWSTSFGNFIDFFTQGRSIMLCFAVKPSTFRLPTYAQSADWANLAYCERTFKTFALFLMQLPLSFCGVVTCTVVNRLFLFRKSVVTFQFCVSLSSVIV